MAKELEEGQTASQQDAGTGGEGQQSADAGGAADSGQQADGSVQDGSAGQGGASGGELEKLRTDYQELQSKFTETSQELARNREMMETIKPYIDYSRLQPPGAPQAGQQPNVEHEGEEVYLTDRQVKELLANQDKQFRQELAARDVRAKYPDVCDNGPKEMVVRYFLQNDTSPYESPDKRIDRAVKKAKEFIENERKAGKTEAEKARQAAEQEAKKKAAAAAQMSGTGSAGPTTPTQQEPPTEMSGSSYIEQRKNKRAATQTVAP
jgi:hypothetical protein